MLLYIAFACLMQFTALFNAVCSYNACLCFIVYFTLRFALLLLIQMIFVFILCHCVIDTYTSIITLHHVLCF